MVYNAAKYQYKVITQEYYMDSEMHTELTSGFLRGEPLLEAIENYRIAQKLLVVSPDRDSFLAIINARHGILIPGGKIDEEDYHFAVKELPGSPVTLSELAYFTLERELKEELGLGLGYNGIMGATTGSFLKESEKLCVVKWKHPVNGGICFDVVNIEYSSNPDFIPVSINSPEKDMSNICWVPFSRANLYQKSLWQNSKPGPDNILAAVSYAQTIASRGKRSDSYYQIDLVGQ